MSILDYQVNSLHITNNNPGVIKAEVVLASGTVLQLTPLIQPNTYQHFHLTTEDGIHNGEEFTVRVVEQDTLQEAQNPTVLTYENSAPTHRRAIFVVSGSAVVPKLEWSGTEPQ